MNAERVSGKNRNAVNLEKQRDVVCEMRDEAHEKAENKSDSSVRNSINTQKQKHRWNTEQRFGVNHEQNWVEMKEIWFKASEEMKTAELIH